MSSWMWFVFVFNRAVKVFSTGYYSFLFLWIKWKKTKWKKDLFTFNQLNWFDLTQSLSTKIVARVLIPKLLCNVSLTNIKFCTILWLPSLLSFFKSFSLTVPVNKWDPATSRPLGVSNFGKTQKSKKNTCIHQIHRACNLRGDTFLSLTEIRDFLQSM